MAIDSHKNEDEFIRRAFRWSVATLALIAVLMVAAGLYLRNSPSTPGNREALKRIEPPAAPFQAIATGIDFVHQTGAYGEKLLPETMGGGVAFFDCEGDGDQDLLFVNGTAWPWDTNSPRATSSLAFYRNNGQGQYANATPGSGLEASFYGMGVAAGDYDNDGLTDLFVTALGPNRLFHNEGEGHFRDVTAAAGVAGEPDRWSTSCAFADYDNDGELDLFVCNYVQWSRQIDLDVDYRLAGIGRAYGPPHHYSGTYLYLYRNEGNGRFTDVSAASGVQVENPASGLPAAKALGVAPVDVDGDGWMDFVVANDTVQNFMFHSKGNGTFEELGAASGLAFDSYGQTRGAMGIDSARFRNDQRLGIAIGNFANEMNALYVTHPDALLFADQAVEEGLGLVSRDLLKFGLFFFDYDLDGRLDVLTANGHLEEEISKVHPAQQYRQPAQLFWNVGAPEQRFALVPPETCGDLCRPMVGRGSAFADIDGDGDLDVVLTQIGGPPMLLRNDLDNGHHWLRLRLVGVQANRDAIGAWVKMRVAGKLLWRQVMPTKGYLSQSELPLTFGLGSHSDVESIEIVWPGGQLQTVPFDGGVDRSFVIQQAE